MAAPTAVRQAVVDKLRTLLSAIVSPTYLFNVGPTRVHMKEVINATTACPALMVVQRTEAIQWASVGRHLERTLAVQVGFLAEYNGPDPDETAVAFMAEIERAVGFQHFITVTDYDTGLVTAQHPIAFYVRGNAINVGEPLEGRVYGQIDYEVQYFTSVLDPRKL